MGLIDDKRNVFSTIKAYTSLKSDKEMPVLNDILPSVDNKKDVGSFLVDALGVVVGTAALKKLTGELFSDLADKIEPKLKSSMKKQLTDFNSGDVLPESFTADGMSIPIKTIDLEGKFKNSPQSPTGSLLYDVNVHSFDNTSYTAIQTEGTFVEYGNTQIKFDPDLDNFVFKPTNPSQNVGDYLSGYVDNATFINKQEFSTKIMDKMFGSISSNENKSVEEIYNELQTDELIQKFINGDDDLEISQNDYARLLKKAEELKNGATSYDMGCGIIESKLNLDDLSDLIGVISCSTDPNEIANKIDDALMSSFDNTDTSDENAETIRNGFFAKLIQFLQNELSKLLVTSPQARMLLAVSSSFQNGGIPDIGDIKDDMKKYKAFIKCIIKDALAILYEYMFDMIVLELVWLLIPIIKTITEEKINAYIGVIKSLISSKIKA